MLKWSFILTLLAFGVWGQTALTGQSAVRLAILPTTFAPTQAHQEPAGPDLTFETASVKENRSGDEPFRIRILPGGQLTATNVTVRQLIALAYGTPAPRPTFQMAGGPTWIDAERFDVAAKANVDGHPEPFTPNEISLMVRQLLVERFHLQAHTEIRRTPVYELVLDGKSKQRPRPSVGDCVQSAADPSHACGIRFGAVPGRLAFRAVAMPALAATLSRLVSRVVVEKTHLTGAFDGSLEWAPAPGEFRPTASPNGDVAGNATETGVSLFTALRQQLGLLLRPAKAPVDALVISSIDRPLPN